MKGSAAPAVIRAQISYLSVQCDGAGLTLGADPLWPGRVALAARLDLAADVLQRRKLSPEDEQSRNYNRDEGRKISGREQRGSYLSAPPVSLRRYAWNDMCFTGGSR